MAPSTPSLDAEPVVASEEEEQALRALDAAFDRMQPARLVAEGFGSVELPPSVHEILARVVHALADGHAVTVLPVHVELTTQDAADLLNVSRPYVISLIDKGTLTCARTAGGHRRLQLAEVLAYKRSRDTERRAALDEMSAEAERLGLEY
jgi:excisionase family DNA binding protein